VVDLVREDRTSVRSHPMVGASASRRISEATVARLPIYQRILLGLVGGGTTTVSSEQLAQLAQLNAAKVRKDLSYLGSFGTRGSGYDTRFLLGQIDRELGLDADWPVAVVGIGNLGRALANSRGFASRGFRIVGLFDIAPEVIGVTMAGIEVHHVDDLPIYDNPAIGVITTPASVAQEVAERLMAVGARSILNFAPVVLMVPPEILVRNVDLSIELQVTSFYLSHQQAWT